MVTSALHIMQYDCAIYTRSFPLVSGFKDPSLYFISEHEGPGRMTSDTMPVPPSPSGKTRRYNPDCAFYVFRDEDNVHILVNTLLII